MNEQMLRAAIDEALLTKAELREFIESFTATSFEERSRQPAPSGKENPFRNVPRCMTF